MARSSPVVVLLDEAEWTIPTKGFRREPMLVHGLKKRNSGGAVWGRFLTHPAGTRSIKCGAPFAIFGYRTAFPHRTMHARVHSVHRAAPIPLQA